MQVIKTPCLPALPVAPAVSVDMEESQLGLSVFISVGRMINLWENTHLERYAYLFVAVNEWVLNT